jgi:O-antigen/teichoic acid export membrane protein
MENKPKHQESLDKENLDKSLKLIVKTSFIVFIGLVLSKLLGYAYRIIIARYYGPETYGVFSLALTIYGLFSIIAVLGLSDGLLRFIPIYNAKNQTDEIRYLFRKVLKFSLVSGVIAGILLFFFSDFIAISIFHNQSLSTLLKLFSIMVVLAPLINMYLTSLRALEHIGWYSFILNILQNIIRVAVLAVFIWSGVMSASNTVTVAYILSSAIVLIITYIVCRYKVALIFGKSKIKNNPQINKEVFSYSWPIMFYSIISMMFYWIDSFSIGYYKSALEVGLYNAAVPIAMLLGFFPEIFMQLFFPLINREYSAKNVLLIEQLSKQVTKWIFIAVLPIFILLFFFPGAALNTLFGPEYLVAENALRILLIGSFISAIFIVSNQLISMTGKSKLVLMNIIIACILNLVLNSFLVPMQNIFFLDNSNGLVGASLATMISVVIFNLLFFIQVKKHLSFTPLRRKMITISLVSLIPTFLLFYLRETIPLTPLSIVLVSALYFLIYGILIIISHALDDKDWMIIKSIFRKVFNPSK